MVAWGIAFIWAMAVTHHSFPLDSGSSSELRVKWVTHHSKGIELPGGIGWEKRLGDSEGGFQTRPFRVLTSQSGPPLSVRDYLLTGGAMVLRSQAS